MTYYIHIDSKHYYFLFAICMVRLSMYICKVEFSDVSLSTSDWTLCTRATSAEDARLATV